MALTKLTFTPGIIQETTNYSNSGGWFQCDKVRFRQGYPEKMGGWLAVTSEPFLGVCRHIHQWSDLEFDRYVALGTSSHLYILWSQSYYDITPIRTTISLALNPFTGGGAGTNQATVAVPGHAAFVGDYVIFSGATTGLDVFPASTLNQQYQVIGTPDANTITITLPGNLSASGATGGGPSVTAEFLISSGLADAVIGQGWGISPWGGTAPGSGLTTGWGQAFDATKLYPVNPTVNQLRIWDLDNFGEDLVANIRGGPIYIWHQANGLSRQALPLTQATTVGGITFTPLDVPTVANQMIVSPNDRHLIAMGCPDVGQTNADLLLVRWSNEEDAYTWTPLRTNSAGGQRLGAGSYIIAGMRTANTILIWTDLGLWSMTYIGMPYVFGFQEIAEGLSILGPNAAINIGTAVLWMDRGIFYSYTGQVQELACTLKDYVFSDLNYLQSYKIYAGHNHAFSEVTWFYPSADSLENNRYVTYNYAEQLWTMGTMERTAWLDMGRSSYPIACDRQNGLLYYHEYGDDANGQPMSNYIDSADIDAGGGDHYMFLSRFIPDVLFRGAAGQNQSVGVTIFGRPAPLEPKVTMAQLQVTPFTGQQYIRVRDRQISFRIESTALGVGWRLGTVRADWQADGKR